MLRAILKSSVLFAFGRVPGGSRLYRELTRNWMGTQATHVDKLRRVWPGYLAVWEKQCKLPLNDANVWIHEGGWTPFPHFANYLFTGKAGVVTNSEGRILDRYLARAVNGALSLKLDANPDHVLRGHELEPLRWSDTSAKAISQLGGIEVETVRGEPISLDSNSVDLCHSGGALEHYTENQLSAFLIEMHRILKPGGGASHVFDHRDHLYHADRKIPFLAHLGWSDLAYSFWSGHPLGFHNRLLPDDISALFEKAGFEKIAVRRMILPDRKYVIGDEAKLGDSGITRSALAKRFRNAPDADLCSAAVHYLFRKPCL